MNYTYDAGGNRTQAGPQVFTYDGRNQQLTGADGTNTWTARGTLAASTKNTVVSNYVFDGLGRMTTAGAASFTYDGLDRVHQRTAADNTNTFTYAGTRKRPDRGWD